MIEWGREQPCYGCAGIYRRSGWRVPFRGAGRLPGEYRFPPRGYGSGRRWGGRMGMGSVHSAYRRQRNARSIRTFPLTALYPRTTRFLHERSSRFRTVLSRLAPGTSIRSMPWYSVPVPVVNG